ncbi:MAG TPA: phospholipase D-like domain-containing protein [Candidatus Saccharimonadales bacterium]|nr:phospholipase D-like domain-containing protein [Candidatus Saccharimonadales bacterium]
MKTKKAAPKQQAELQVLAADNYHAALVKAITKAKKRVVLAAMVVVWGERTAPVFEAVKEAVQRGVQVTILLDNYTRLSSRYHLQPRITRNERIERTFKTLEELSSLGATIHCFGKIGIVPYKGRCHVKISVIDDTFFSFGGVNLVDQDFGQQDYMMQGTNAATAAQLDNLVRQIGTQVPPLPDSETSLTGNNTMLFDGGRQGHSIIYERACELVAHAKRVYYVSQYTPSGHLAELMHETETTCYYNRPEQLAVPDAWAQAFDQQRYRIDNTYTGASYIHAKFILAELKSGQYASICGSHNFSYRGVAFGTQELALYSTDKAIWNQLHAFMKQLT